MKAVIRWNTRDRSVIERIRRRFGIPSYTTVNGLSPVEVKEADTEMFTETARRGFFTVMPMEWRKNGDVFSFIYR